MKKTLAFAFAILCLLACSDDDSSVSAGLTSDFECLVTTGTNSVSQKMTFPGRGNSTVKFVFNDDGSAVESFLVEKSNDVCDSLDESEFLFEKDSYSCKDGSYSFDIVFDSKSAPTKRFVRDAFEEQCAENEEEWKNLTKHPEASSARVSSSSNKVSSSSQREKNSSSSEKIESSSREEISSSSGKSSSSEKNYSSSMSDVIDVFEFDGAGAADREIVMDEYTLQYEPFKILAQKNLNDSSAEAYAISLNSVKTYDTGWKLETNLAEGSLEFFFRPHNNFDRAEAYALVGTDGARLLVYYDDGNLVFMMNKTNQFDFVKAPADILDGWNFVCAQWVDGKMSLFLNGTEIGSDQIDHGYEYSTRYDENEMLVGYKSSCCMEGAGRGAQMYSAADFGPIRLSSMAREREISSGAEEN